MLREAATAQVIGARKGYAGDNGPALEAWLDTPGGIAVAPSGELYFADSNNHVIRRIDPRNRNISTVVGNNALGPGFSGDFGPATAAQLEYPRRRRDRARRRPDRRRLAQRPDPPRRSRNR